MAELAREVWRDRELSERLDREAEELQAKFNQAFWNESRGVLRARARRREAAGRLALLEHGHLLWSGIVPPERVDKVVDA